ncbi:MAG: alpha/beta hydrolase [Aureispira sp.]|nr:alpha/beta hydrolase [Aureispira sp.]
MRTFIILSIVLVLLLTCLSSCSIFKIADGHIKKKLKRSGMQFHTLETEEYTITYWDTGDQTKPPYVLLHGFGASTRFQWHGQAKKLTKTHRLILPNLLYFGSTPKKEGLYHISDQVQVMTTLLEHLKLDTMVLGGISYGGVVAAELALTRADKVQKLTLFSTPVKYFKESDLTPIEKDFEVDDLGELLIPKDHKVMRDLFKLTMYKPPAVPGFILKDLHKNLYQHEANNNGQIELLNALRADVDLLSNRNYAFDFPVLLVWGEADKLIPPRIGNQLKEHLSNSELHMIPKAGHAPCVEQKRKFNKILLDFLAEN